MTNTLKRTLILAAALAPVVGMSVRPATAAIKYWDLNDAAPGSGVSPTGTWDTVNANWNDTADGTGADVTFATSDFAVFAAGSDAITYTVTGTGVVASGARVEDGTMTVIAGVLDTSTGAFTIGTGAGSTARLNINSTSRVNTAGKFVLDGGTLFETNGSSGGSFIPATKGIEITAVGGTVGYDDSTATTASSLYAGTITGTGGTTTAGVGTLTKSGPDEFRYQGAGTANSTFQKLVVNQGLFRLGFVSGASPSDVTIAENGFGADSTTLLTDAITLNGGQIGASLNVTLNANRGITIGASGGGLNGSGGGVMIIQGPISGSGQLTNLSGSATLSNATNVTTFTGSLATTAGTLTLAESLNATNLTGAGGTISVSSGKTLTVGSDGTSTSYSGTVSGAGNLTKTGAGVLTIATNFLNTGATNIDQGTIKFGVSAAGLSTGPINIAAAGTFDMNNIGDTLGPIGGAGPIINAGNITTGGTPNSNYSGAITKGTVTAGTFTKNGAGTLTFIGTSDHGGATTVSAGTLALGNTAGAALTATSGVTVTSSLVLAASDQINNAATFSFNGGTFNTGGFSEGSFDGSNVGVAGLGAVAMTVSSVLDLATSAGSVVAYSGAGAFTAGTVLKIYNWSGNPLVGNGIDRLYVGTDATGLSSTQLGQIQFYSDAGTTFLGTAGLLSTGEVVAVPEPTSLAVLGLAAGLFGRRRRQI